VGWDRAWRPLWSLVVPWRAFPPGDKLTLPLIPLMIATASVGRRRPPLARGAPPGTTKVCGAAQLNRSGKYRSNIAGF